MALVIGVKKEKVYRSKVIGYYCRRFANKRGGPPSKGLSDLPKL
jgi:hypothetical protein